MSPPATIPASPLSRPRRLRPPLLRLLEASRHDRLHPALLLVACYRIPPDTVLDLTWPTMPRDADADPWVLELLHWHGCRQRLDMHRAGPSWRASRRVFVDSLGHPYTSVRADDVVSRLAEQVGLPPLTLGSLAHPCWTA